MKKILFILLLFSCCIVAHAQPDSTTTTDSAVLYLTGTFKKYNPQKAFQLFTQRANAGESKAMNALGMHYAKGLGVDSNFTLAKYWFLQAAGNGYHKAWVNAGMLYKTHSTDSAGYAVAV
ncbi:MAG: sel1 repeat family protein, partial [Chitinophagaceae bacterium]|nr:sel1 repeat family protein [Chitinophagaceae bacterium]